MDGSELDAVCPVLSGADVRFDCNEDDYYNPDPRPGRYLATHWNVAESPWVER